MNKILTTRSQLRYTLESGRRIIFEPGAVISSAPPPPSYSYLPNVVLLMGFEGANGATGAPGMNDESSAAHGTGTVSGSVAIGTDQFKFGSSSLKTVTSNDLVNFPDSADWQLSTVNTSQYTIELWLKLSSFTVDCQIIGQAFNSGSQAWYLWLRVSGGNLEFGTSSDGTNFITTVSAGLGISTAGGWYAIAIDKDVTGKIRVYCNGAMVASGTPADSFMFDSPQQLHIGTWPGNNGFIGWMDELRITKGFARYASDAGYTLPTIAFPRGEGSHIVAGTPPFAVEASATTSLSAGTSWSAVLSATYANDVIFAVITSNVGNVVSVSDTSGVTSAWTLIARTGGASNIEIWYATASAPFVRATITAAVPANGFAVMCAFVVSGANMASLFDGSAITGSSDPLSITTTNANDMIIAGYRFSSTTVPTQGINFMLVSTNGQINSYTLAETRVISSAGTYSAPVGTGAGTANGGIIIAIKKHP